MTTMASVTFLAQEILGTEDLPDYQAGSRRLSTETSIKRSTASAEKRKTLRL